MRDQEAENSDQTENRESEIATSCMKLVLDQHSAGIGRRADHDKPKTMVCSHLADPRNQERCQTTTTRNSRLVQRGKTQRVAMSWTASYMDAKIRLF